MASKFQELERIRLENLIKSGNPVFHGDKAGKLFMTKNRAFVLENNMNNIYSPIKTDVIDYFTKNNISWWRGNEPTGHVLSSQIACINHLFYLRHDKNAVMTILNNASTDFCDVLPIVTDSYNPAFIQFESVSDNDHLNENALTRGSNCTSIDALIYAIHNNGSKWLIPIEWKYTEYYNNTDKSIEDSDRKSLKYSKGDEAKGKERLDRYCYNKKGRLIDASNYLKSLTEYRNSVYFFEPFYQLMRQTLWAEQMIKFKNNERLKADNYLHLHIIPTENLDLLQKKYKCSGKNMESTWKDHLNDQSKYLIISPKNFMTGLDKQKYGDLLNYLLTRY